MARARSLAERDYVLKADRKLEEKEQTVWWIRPLTNRERARLLDGATRGTIRAGQRDEERQYKFTASAIDIVAAALVRVERFFDTDGTTPLAVPTDRTGKAMADFLDKIELKDIGELSGAILQDAELSEDEEKNSASQSASPGMSNGLAAETPTDDSAAPVS